MDRYTIWEKHSGHIRIERSRRGGKETWGRPQRKVGRSWRAAAGWEVLASVPAEARWRCEQTRGFRIPQM